jgi:hypothetical protein
MPDKASTTLPATVEKVVKSIVPSEPEKAQITVEGADHLYKEIRVENNLTDENGQEVRLKPGAKVQVTIKAGPDAIQSKEIKAITNFNEGDRVLVTCSELDAKGEWVDIPQLGTIAKAHENGNHYMVTLDGHSSLSLVAVGCLSPAPRSTVL